MNKKTLSFRKRFEVFICLTLLLTEIFSIGIPKTAKADVPYDHYLGKFYNQFGLGSVKPNIIQTAAAYLVGTDNVVNSGNTVPISAVEIGTEIQGKKLNSLYFPQKTLQYLEDVKQNYVNNFQASDRIYRLPDGTQYVEMEGAFFTVVDYDENWVTFFDRGYCPWEVQGNAAIFALNLHKTDMYLEAHGPGFYRIERNKVWLDTQRPENHPYKSVSEVPNEWEGTTTARVFIRPLPDENDKKYGPVYAVKKGTKLNVLSDQPVESQTEGSTRKFYKVAFTAKNNGVYYMRYKVPGVYYVDSRYVTVKKAVKETKKVTKTVIKKAAKKAEKEVIKGKAPKIKLKRMYKGKRVAVKYTATKKVAGFQARYKKNGGKWKKVTYFSKKTITRMLPIRGKGKYTIQARSFTKGRKTYSKWSKAKKIRIKI